MHEACAVNITVSVLGYVFGEDEVRTIKAGVLARLHFRSVLRRGF